MKIGFFEAMITPAEVMLQDLEFIDMINRYGEKKPDKDKKKNKQGLNR